MISYRTILIVLLIFNSALFSQTISVGKVLPAGNPSHALVPVSISQQLNNVKSFTMQFSYDVTSVGFNHQPASIQSGILNNTLPDPTKLFVSDKNGSISMSWTSANPAGAALNGKLFDMDFLYAAGFSEIRFVSASFKDIQGKKIAVTLTHGSISTTADPALKIFYPNGGETFEVIGAPANITWTTIYISNINLEYTTDNGAHWNTIVDNYDALKNSYAWTVPNSINSTDCKIKISENIQDNPAFDESNGVFTINSTPVVTLTAPNGGEELQVGGIKTIKWTCKNILNVKLEYCTDASAPAPAWQVISNSIPAGNHTYEWTIPNSVSADCKIRISDVANPAVSDLTDASFKIFSGPVRITIDKIVQAKLKIIGKVTGLLFHYWLDTDNHWSITDAHYEDDYVKYDIGDTLFVYGTVPVNIGWVTSLKYLEMVLNYNPDVLVLESLIPIPEMEKINYSFENGVIRIIWTTTEPVDIHGKIFDLKFRYVKFQNPEQWLDETDDFPFMANYVGTQDPRIPTADIDPRNFSDIIIEKIDAKNSRDNLVNTNDWVNGSLAMSNLPAVKLLSPLGGDFLEVNDVTHDVLWAKREVNNVKLEYTTNDGGSWTDIINTTPAAAGKFIWTLPDVNSADCRIRISKADDGSIIDQSPKFTISNVKSVDLTYPNGGEVLKTGTTNNITWSCRNINNVKLEYTTDAGTTWNNINASVPAKNYKYPWLIPAVISTDCKVRVSNAADAALLNESTNVFTINNSKSKIKIPAQNLNDGVSVIPVITEQLNGATYFYFTIRFNTSAINVLKVFTNAKDEAETSVVNSGIFSYTANNGVIRVTWFSTTPVNIPAGRLFNIKVNLFESANWVFQFEEPYMVKDDADKEMDIELIVEKMDFVSDVKDQNNPGKYALQQNFPNPFNPNTIIRYELPEESHVTITIFNNLGERITTLVNEINKPGYYNIEWNAKNYASGIYLYSIVTKDFIQTKKMILLK